MKRKRAHVSVKKPISVLTCWEGGGYVENLCVCVWGGVVVVEYSGESGFQGVFVLNQLPLSSFMGARSVICGFNQINEEVARVR